MTEEDARGGRRWRQIIQGPAKRRRTRLVNVFIYLFNFTNCVTCGILEKKLK